MASVIHLDTHVAAWLYAGRSDLFPPRVRRLLEGEELVVSPMVLLELQYLHEVGKATEPGHVVMAALQSVLEVRVCSRSFQSVATAAAAFDFTSDPFDRLITAQADVAEAALISKDRSIRKFYSRAVWE